MEELPGDIILEILTLTPYIDIIKFCQCSKTIRKICDTRVLWVKKLREDYGVSCSPSVDNPKEMYKSLSVPYVFATGRRGTYDIYNSRMHGILSPICCSCHHTMMRATYAAIGTKCVMIRKPGNDMLLFRNNSSRKNRVKTFNEYRKVHLGNRENFKMKSAATGRYHSVIIDEDNNAWISLSDENIFTPIVYAKMQLKAILSASGDNHVVMVGTDNNVFSFGRNDEGQLGLGGNLGSTLFNQVFIDPYSDNPTALKAKYVAAGGNHTIVIDMKNEVWVFGCNRCGQLGLRGKKEVSVPTKLFHRGKPMQALHVAAGSYHTVIIDMDNFVWSVGRNDSGQLGLCHNGRETVFTQVVVRQSSSRLIPLRAKFVAVGDIHSVVIDTENNVWGFGDDKNGSLGLNGPAHRSGNLPAMLFLTYAGSRWSVKAHYVAAGGKHTVILGHRRSRIA